MNKNKKILSFFDSINNFLTVVLVGAILFAYFGDDVLLYFAITMFIIPVVVIIFNQLYRSWFKIHQQNTPRKHIFSISISYVKTPIIIALIAMVIAISFR